MRQELRPGLLPPGPRSGVAALTVTAAAVWPSEGCGNGGGGGNPSGKEGNRGLG